MTFQNMLDIVFWTHAFPQNATDTEYVHLLALHGLNAAFEQKHYSKQEAGRLKELIRSHFEKERGADRKVYDLEYRASNYMDIIRKTLLLAGNPYAALLSACDCIALLMNQPEFGTQAHDIVRDVHADVLGDGVAIEAAVVDLESKMKTLLSVIHQAPTTPEAHRRAMAYAQMKIKLSELQEKLEKQDRKPLWERKLQSAS